MVTTFAHLVTDLEAHDPDVLAAEVARLQTEVKRLTRLLDTYEHVPFRDALNYTRRHYGLPPLPGTVVMEIDRALQAARLQSGVA